MPHHNLTLASRTGDFRAVHRSCWARALHAPQSRAMQGLLSMRIPTMGRGVPRKRESETERTSEREKERESMSERERERRSRSAPRAIARSWAHIWLASRRALEGIQACRKCVHWVRLRRGATSGGGKLPHTASDTFCWNPPMTASIPLPIQLGRRKRHSTCQCFLCDTALLAIKPTGGPCQRFSGIVVRRSLGLVALPLLLAGSVPPRL